MEQINKDIKINESAGWGTIEADWIFSHKFHIQNTHQVTGKVIFGSGAPSSNLLAQINRIQKPRAQLFCVHTCWICVFIFKHFLMKTRIKIACCTNLDARILETGTRQPEKDVLNIIT